MQVHLPNHPISRIIRVYPFGLTDSEGGIIDTLRLDFKYVA
jgi:hypothetical protein